MQAEATALCDKVVKRQKERLRELRNKRRKGGKTAEARTTGRQGSYFKPTLQRGTTASQAFTQATGTGGSADMVGKQRQGLASSPMRGSRRPASSRWRSGSVSGGRSVSRRRSARMWPARRRDSGISSRSRRSRWRA